MQEKFGYKAFISYSHSDRKWAEWLHRALETYRVPRFLVGTQTPAGLVPARLRPVFRDREDLASSPDLSARIQQALASSQFLIVICSPAAASSTWVNREIQLFRELGKTAQVLCVIVDGEPTTSGSADSCFPPALLHHTDTDGLVEPSAADVRKQADGRALALAKIIAGLLGVGLDVIRQRELHRRQRRLLVTTGVSVIAASITLTLAINATLARNEATQRRQQAEDLLGFMVGDLRNSLAPIGRLDLLEAVGQQALNYFATTDVSLLTESELLKQAQILTQIGEIRTSQLQYSEALEAFNEAYERSAALYLNDSEDNDRLFNRSQAEFWVGFIHWRNGSPEAARSWLTRYLQSAELLFARDPSRLDWLREVAYGLHNLGVLEQESDNLDAALELFERELAILDNLLATAPTRQLQRDRADTLSFLGNISLLQNDLEGALERHRASADTIRAIYEEQPDNARWLDDLAFATLRLSETALYASESAQATDFAFESGVLFDRLVAIDESNTNWRRAWAKTQTQRARLLAAQGSHSEALQVNSVAIDTLQMISANLTADHNVNDHIAFAFALQAWLNHMSADLDAAANAIDAAIAALEAIESSAALNNERLGLKASLLILKSDISGELNRPDDSRQYLADAIALLELASASQSRSPFIRYPWNAARERIAPNDDPARANDTINLRSYHPFLPLTL